MSRLARRQATLFLTATRMHVFENFLVENYKNIIIGVLLSTVHTRYLDILNFPSSIVDCFDKVSSVVLQLYHHCQFITTINCFGSSMRKKT